MVKTFYVCSYGGCGSKMLCNALKQFGKVEHVHSRKPPDKLQYIGKNGGGDAYSEWFNGKNIPDDKIKDYIVIYIYRNPSFSIESRFKIKNHLIHIQSDENINFNDVLDTGNDLYKIREFYDNYTLPNAERNYKIYSVKYEDIFDRQDELSNVLGVGKLNLVNKSTRLKCNERLSEIYKDFIDIMNKNEFIMIN
jgi:hypothetical protein